MVVRLLENTACARRKMCVVSGYRQRAIKHWPMGLKQMTAEQMIAAAMRIRAAQGFKIVVEMPEGQTDRKSVV